jgi:hypothetical protein
LPLVKYYHKKAQFLEVPISTGLTHRCFHEVDRKNYPVVYWNKFFIGLSSKNTRASVYWVALASDDGWKMKNRISWDAHWGLYLREFFGLVSPTKLNGYNPYTQVYELNSRFAFYKRRSWVVAFHGKSSFGPYEKLIGATDSGGFYWRQDFGLESYFRRGNRGAAFYINFILDDLPRIQGIQRFSKDRLCEIGIMLLD